MKTLLLLRHAKSGWGDPGCKDFDRPLKKKGRESAALVGAHILASGRLPDSIISSPAMRARQTTDCIMAAVAGPALAPPTVYFEKNLYEAPVEAILQVARSVSGEPAVLMLVGHNPSMHMAALKLSEGDAVNPDERALASFPTAGLASFTFEEALWRDISWQGATMLDFATPKVLRG